MCVRASHSPPVGMCAVEITIPPGKALLRLLLLLSFTDFQIYSDFHFFYPPKHFHLIYSILLFSPRIPIILHYLSASQHLLADFIIRFYLDFFY